MDENKLSNSSVKQGFAPVNIPIQVFCVVDTSGKINPIRFRYENSEHQIETVVIEEIISYDEKRYVGIREKQFICVIIQEEKIRTVEIRYHVDSQKWRIFRFLS